MKPLPARERRLWIATAIAVAAIFLSLYPLQFALDFLRERNLLRAAIATIFANAAAAAIVAVARRGARLRDWVALGAGAAVYAAVALWLDVVQERLHLVEYGALALLLRALFSERRSARGLPPGEGRSARAAFLAASGIGFADEIVQGILPNRQYDLRDVGLNALAAAMALALFAALTQRGGEVGQT